jgi:hypothetical protein
MTIKYFPFYVLLFVDGSSLTSNDNFRVRHPLMLSYNYYVNVQHKYPSCVSPKSGHLRSAHYRNHLSAVLAASVFANVCLDSLNIRTCTVLIPPAPIFSTLPSLPHFAHRKLPVLDCRGPEMSGQ